jgi:hypothetical protein
VALPAVEAGVQRRTARAVAAVPPMMTAQIATAPQRLPVVART